MIKERSPADPAVYTDPGQTFTLPFPAVGIFPEDRFTFEEGNFTYFGRERFTELWKSVIQLEKRWGQLFFYGTAGYGKSHILAALACLLVSQGKRVVFLPHCRAMSRDFVDYITEALLLAFGDSPKHQEQIVELQKEEDIKLFLKRYAKSEGKLYFIVDQLNALEVAKEDRDQTSNTTKEHISEWLNAFTGAHCRVQSASPNYQTFHYLQKRQTNDCKIAALGGFSKVSI